MEWEHPVPQQISSYQFRLVGDMTLKQFFQVAGGVVLALIVYSSDIYSFIKWPLVIIFFLMGIGMAFFPIQDRPLEKWIVLFFNAIYSPTIYIWKQMDNQVPYFQPEEGNIPIPRQGGIRVIGTDTGTASAAQPEVESVTRLEKAEEEMLNRINKHLANVNEIQVQAAQEEIKKTETAPTSSQAAVDTVTIPTQTVKKEDEAPTRPPVTVFESQPIEITRQEKTEEITKKEEKATSIYDAHLHKVDPFLGQKSGLSQTAQFASNSQAPMPPISPNVLVGQVVGPDGAIVENAIIEIRDDGGRVVRALKSNKLGHFMIATPLSTGKYEIITEKEGLKFSPVTIQVSDQIIQPIAIWGQKQAQQI